MEEMYHEEELRLLFRKYLQKNCTEEEVKLLMSYSEQETFFPLWQLLLEEVDEERSQEELYTLYKPVIDNAYAQLTARAEGQRKQQPTIVRYWWAAAAAVLLLLSAGIYLTRQPGPAPQAQVHDVLPGTDKATLTLADGSVIPLDSAGSQVLLQGATAIRQQGGQLIYDAGETAGDITYNTLHTPRGGQFRITLPDGTSVWLNAASSLRYPTAFTGKERTVEITGEAYFEVTKNPRMPFRVKIAGQAEVEVLGTRFNITAYENEHTIKTTLMEGSVKMHAKGQALVLTPGQQAELNAAGQLLIVKDANTAQATAKDAFFTFNKADLPTVMRQLARWYDLEVIYQDTIPQAEFTGDIDKSLTLDQVLKGLARNRIRYRIEEDRKLIILP